MHLISKVDSKHWVLARTLIFGLVGLLLALALQLPLPFLLGPLLFIGLLSVLRVPMQFIDSIRSPTFGLLGLYIGSAVSEQAAIFQSSWVWTSILMFFFSFVATALGALYFRYCAAYSKAESLLASMPGALAPIASYITDNNIPPFRIIPAQTIRVVVLVGLSPFIYQWITGNEEPAIALQNWQTLSWLPDFFLLLLISTPCIWCMKRLNIPNAWFLGCMSISLIAYLVGWVDSALPSWFLYVVLFFIGTMIGMRFAGIGFADLAIYSWHGLAFTVLLLAFTLCVAFFGAWWLQKDIISMFLAFAPGGVHEMTVIAVNYDVEPLFVVFHHILRLFIISFSLPLIAHLVRFWRV